MGNRLGNSCTVAMRGDVVAEGQLAARRPSEQRPLQRMVRKGMGVVRDLARDIQCYETPRC